MHELEELRQTFVDLIDQDDRRRLARQKAIDRERLELAARRSAFEHTACRWMTQLSLPRLELLVEQLPAKGVVELEPSGLRAVASFPSNAEFPAAASLTITISPVDRYQTARVEITPLLIPMLNGHPAATARDFDLESPLDLPEFLDRGVVAFAHSYLHVRDPESPYQLGRAKRA